MIENYLNNHLAPHLEYFGLPADWTESIIADVRRRLVSILSRWDDLPFRYGMLVIGAEEGSNYSPFGASYEARALTVIAVRNSLIEDAHSDHPRNGLAPLARPVADIKAITKQAILYWNKLLRGKIEVPLPTAEEDVFGRLPARYQITWHAFLRLSVMKTIEEIYPPVKVSSPPEAFAATGEIDGTIRNVSLSGIDPEIDPQLADTLAAVQSGEIGYFYSHSLKHITRNPEKLFRVIEAVLASNAGVVTPNYLITNGRVCRRAKLLKPSDQDVIAQMTNYQGISAEHKSALLDTYRSLQE